MSPKSVTCLHGFVLRIFQLLIYSRCPDCISEKNKFMKEKTHFIKYKTKKNPTQNWLSHLKFFFWNVNELKITDNDNLKQVVSFISLLSFQSNYRRWLDQIKNKNVNKIIQKGLLSPLPLPRAIYLMLSLASFAFCLCWWFLQLYILQY